MYFTTIKINKLKNLSDITFYQMFFCICEMVIFFSSEIHKNMH